MDTHFVRLDEIHELYLHSIVKSSVANIAEVENHGMPLPLEEFIEPFYLLWPTTGYLDIGVEHNNYELIGIFST